MRLGINGMEKFKGSTVRNQVARGTVASFTFIPHTNKQWDIQGKKPLDPPQITAGYFLV